MVANVCKARVTEFKTRGRVSIVGVFDFKILYNKHGVRICVWCTKISAFNNNRAHKYTPAPMGTKLKLVILLLLIIKITISEYIRLIIELAFPFEGDIRKD